MQVDELIDRRVDPVVRLAEPWRQHSYSQRIDNFIFSSVYFTYLLRLFRGCYDVIPDVLWSISKMPSVDKSDEKDAGSDDTAENIW